MKKKIIKNIFFLFFTFLFFAPKIFAQVGIKASPLRIEEVVQPGQTITKLIKITNVADFPQKFFAYVMDFKAMGESGQALLIPPGTEEGPYLSSWIEVFKDGIDFLPGEEKQISVTFKVPPDIGPGGYYGAIVFGPQPPKIDPKEGVALTLTNQVGVLALFHVLGGAIEEARIREFSTDKEIYSTPFNVNFLTRIENLGNVHIKPVGVIEIKNFFGKTVGSLAVNPTGANILPKSIRRFENSWKGELAFGRYSASLLINFGLSAAEGGSGVKNLSAKTYFWIVPWKIVIPSIFIIIFLFTLFYVAVKIYKDKAIKEALREAGLTRIRYIKKYEGPSPTIYLFLLVLIVLILIFLIGFLIFIILF